MRKTITLLLAVSLFSMLVACSNDNDSAQQTDGSEPLSSNPTPTPEANQTQFLAMGNIVTLDFLELTLDRAEWVEEIYPPDTSSWYTYYDDKNGEKFIPVRLKI